MDAYNNEAPAPLVYKQLGVRNAFPTQNENAHGAPDAFPDQNEMRLAHQVNFQKNEDRAETTWGFQNAFARQNENEFGAPSAFSRKMEMHSGHRMHFRTN